MFQNIILSSIFKKDCGALCAMKKPQTLIMKPLNRWMAQSLADHADGNQKRFYHYIILFRTFTIISKADTLEISIARINRVEDLRMFFIRKKQTNAIIPMCKPDMARI